MDGDPQHVARVGATGTERELVGSAGGFPGAGVLHRQQRLEPVADAGVDEQPLRDRVDR
jgi:hypothetical protein